MQIAVQEWNHVWAEKIYDLVNNCKNKYPNSAQEISINHS
jgi:hypothetical protein